LKYGILADDPLKGIQIQEGTRKKEEEKINQFLDKDQFSAR